MRNMDKLSCSYDGRFAPKQCKPGKLDRYLNFKLKVSIVALFKFQTHGTSYEKSINPADSQFEFYNVT